jgi:2-polyprenyl-3-methyl-5-hydroxy-6-metoxy-1,4-benzoquinol methylase
MGGCCDHDGYEAVFSDRFARRNAKRYRRRGLSPAAGNIMSFLGENGVEGATVLEIGGGVGEIQVELLRLGASHVTNLEISTSYETEAAALLEKFGFADRVHRRIIDIATEPDQVEAADVVVLHRVVCCYPDYERLLAAAGSHANRMLVFSHPPRNVVARAVFGSENVLFRMRGDTFRTYVHPPDSMVGVLEAQGLSARYRRRSRGWNVVGLVRR